MSFNQLNKRSLNQAFNQTNGEKILLTLWVGALWAIGYIAVPTLFGTLGDRQLAGALAGKMFTTVSYLGLFCGLLLLLSMIKRASQLKTSLQFWLLMSMLILVIIGEFILQPQMADLKLSGLVSGSQGIGSQEAQQFARLHGIASALYMLNSLLGLSLIVFHGGNNLSSIDVTATDP